MSQPPPNRACGSPAHGSPPDRHPPAGQAPVRERSLVSGWIGLVSTHPAVLLPACDPAARPSLGPGSVVPALQTVLCPAPTPSGSGPHAAEATPSLADPGGSLPFPNGLCLPSTASTPEGSWRLHFPGLHRFHGLRRLEPGSAPSGPPVSRRVSNDAAAFASRCGLQGCSPSRGRLCQRASTEGFRPLFNSSPLSYSAAGTLPRPDLHRQAPWSLSGRTSSAALHQMHEVSALACLEGERYAAPMPDNASNKRRTRPEQGG